MSQYLKSVISGSYRKHFNELIILKKFFESKNFEVLSPTSDGVLNPNEEFIILNEDPIEDHRTLQDSVLAKIRMSTLLIVANVDGYIGKAATFEMGYAVSLGIQILTIEKVEDPNLACYCKSISDIFPDWDPSILKTEVNSYV